MDWSKKIFCKHIQLHIKSTGITPFIDSGDAPPACLAVISTQYYIQSLSSNGKVASHAK